MWRRLPRALVALAVSASAWGASIPGPESKALEADAALRKLDLVAAQRGYESALAGDPTLSRALLGLSRLALGRGHRDRARDLAARAYHLHPNDPEIIRAYAAFVTDPVAERVLWRNYLALAPAEGSGLERQQAATRLRLLDALNGERSNDLSSEYRAYRLPAARFYPAAAEPAAGLILTTHIEGSKPLRLLFDTGARGLYLSRRAAAALPAPLREIGECTAGGAGNVATSGRAAVAATVEFAGGLAFRNVTVDVLDMPFPDGLDGVAGAALFERFLVRASDRHQRLDLEPLEDAAATTHAAARGGEVPAFRSGHLLLLSAGPGVFVLDTGSAFHVLNAPGAKGTPLRLQGAGGTLLPARHTQPVTLALGGRRHFSRSWVAMDLSALARAEGLEIAGLAGYPLLRQSELVINYRDGWVRFVE